MLRKLKWQIPGEPLVARNNWCQGLVPGRGPAVEKHWHSGCALAEDYTFEVNYLFFMLTYVYCVAFVYFSKWLQYFIAMFTLLIFKYTVAISGFRECNEFHHSKISLFSRVINCNQHWFAASWKVQRFSVFFTDYQNFANSPHTKLQL
jgi:hypothetical protein